MLSPDKLTKIVLSLPIYLIMAWNYGWELVVLIMLLFMIHRIGEL